MQIWVSEGQAIAQVARLSPCLSLRGAICPYLTCQSCLLSHPFHMASCILLSNLASIGNSLLDSQGNSSNQPKEPSGTSIIKQESNQPPPLLPTTMVQDFSVPPYFLPVQGEIRTCNPVDDKPALYHWTTPTPR